MPTPDSIVETLYGDVKRELLSGRVLPGQRINIKALCEQYGVSKSPIRNILNRLVGEGLLEVQAHDGFYRPRLTVQSLRELYSWEHDIVLLAIRDIDPGAPQAVTDLPQFSEDSIEDVLRAITDQSGNRLYGAALANVSDHLRAVRRSKRTNLFEIDHEIASIVEAWQSSSLDALRRRLKAYYHRRLTKLSDIVADAYRGRST